MLGELLDPPIVSAELVAVTVAELVKLPFNVNARVVNATVPAETLKLPFTTVAALIVPVPAAECVKL